MRFFIVCLTILLPLSDALADQTSNKVYKKNCNYVINETTKLNKSLSTSLTKVLALHGFKKTKFSSFYKLKKSEALTFADKVALQVSVSQLASGLRQTLPAASIQNAKAHHIPTPGITAITIEDLAFDFEIEASKEQPYEVRSTPFFNLAEMQSTTLVSRLNKKLPYCRVIR